MKVSQKKMIHFTRWGEKYICPDGFYEIIPGYYHRLPVNSELKKETLKTLAILCG